MKTTIIISLSIIVLTACGRNDPSTLFPDTCEKINVDDGIWISDTLNMFEYKIPDSS